MPIVAVLLPLMIALGVAVLAASGRGPFRRFQMDATQASSAEAANLRVRQRNFSALAAAILVAVFLGTAGLSLAADLGRLLLLAPILAASAAIAFFVLAPTAPFHEAAGTRNADLSPRRPWSFGPRWIFVVPAVAAAALLAVTVALGLAADADGRSISHDYGRGASGAGPFPGFFYGVPLLASVVVLACVAAIALVRIASAVRPSDESLREADSTIRLLAIRVVMKSATSALVFTLGIVLLLAGSATLRVANGVQAWVDSVDVSIPPDGMLITLGVIELGTGVIALVAGVVFLLWAVSDAVRKPFELTRLVAEAST